MPTTSAPPERSPRRRVAKSWFSGDGDVRAVKVGLAGTVALHCLLLLLVPYLEHFNWLADDTTLAVDPDESPPSFEIEMAPDLFGPEPESPPLKFVEANPEAPDNVPDRTQNFSFMNQQVAQEKPTEESHSEAPALEGDKEKESTSIVTGRLSPPMPLSQPEETRLAETEEKEQVIARREQEPLPGLEVRQGEAENYGSNIAKIGANSAEVKERIEGEANATETEGAVKGSRVKIDRTRPAERPRLTANAINARPSPLMDNQFGTSNIGPVAYNAKWSNYGDYLKKLIDTVQVQWERINLQAGAFPPPGTRVIVKFRINDKGEVYEVSPPESEGGMQAKYACVSAITARSPYGDWTDDMIAVLGRSQEITFSFYYN